MNVFNLFGKLTLDNSDYNNKIDDAKNKNTEFEKDTKKMSLGAVASWTAIIAVMTKVVDAVKNAISSSLEYSDTIKNLSQIYGDTTKSIQELNYVAQESGKNAEWVLRKAQSSGKSYAEVLGLTNDEYQDMINYANELGLVLDDEVLDRVDTMGDKISALKYQWQALVTSLLAGDEGAEENMRQFFARVGEMVKEYAPTVISFGVQLILQVLIGVVQQAPQILLDLVYAFIDAIYSVNWLDVLWNLIKGIAELAVNTIINGLLGWLKWFGVDIPQVDFTSASSGVSTSSSSGYKLSTNNSTYSEDNSTYNISINTDLTGELNYDAKSLANEVIKQIQVAKQSSGR